MKILIVDLDEDVTATTRDALEVTGHFVLAARETNEAISLAKSLDFDCYLLSCSLPPMGPSAVLQALTSEKNRTKVRKILWSGQLPNDWPKLPAGFDAFLLKPVPLFQLVAALRGAACPTCGLPFRDGHLHNFCSSHY